MRVKRPRKAAISPHWRWVNRPGCAHKGGYLRQWSNDLIKLLLMGGLRATEETPHKLRLNNFLNERAGQQESS